MATVVYMHSTVKVSLSESRNVLCMNNSENRDIDVSIKNVEIQNHTRRQQLI